MQHLTKEILTTKEITKITKGSDIFGYKLRALRSTILEDFRSLRKLSGGPWWLSKRGFARAKHVLSEAEGTPRTPSPEV